MPRKPTQPFGFIAFSKSGEVTKHMTRLSDVKEEQELQVAVDFVTAYNARQRWPLLTGVQPLEQNDHDAIVFVEGEPVQIQITELVRRAYTFEMTQEEWDAGKFQESIQLSSGVRPHRIDPALREQALWRVIENKLSKFYSSPTLGSLWLVVFTVDELYLTEYANAGVPTVSPALLHVRNMLAAQGSGAFSEIWFTNLQTCPVRIWPTLK